MAHLVAGRAGGRFDRHTTAVLARSAILSGLDAADRAAVLDHLDRVGFRSGEAIVRDGQHTGRLYIVIDGKVKIGWCSPDAGEKLLRVAGPSDVFGVESIFDPGPLACSATALSDGAVAVLDRRALDASIAAHPQVAEQLMRILARHLRRAEDHIAELYFTDVPGRTARQLRELAHRFGGRRDRELRLAHGLTQGEMAQLVGASRESVNKALSEFTHRGWITMTGKTMVIHETEPLARRAF